MMAESTPGRAAAALVTLALIAISCASPAATHPSSAVDVAAAQREWSSRARAQIRDDWN
jgi:hypothetical protein